MAILRDGDLSLEIHYREFEFGSVFYDIWLRWRGKPVINDVILKRVNEHWAKRGTGAVKADENDECGVLPLLRKVLESNEADYWESTDPDILLALYPDGVFPFLPSKWRLAYERPDVKEARESREQEREARGPLPDDYIELMLFVDTYNFEGSTAYSGSGICFRLVPTRADLEHFYETLKREYLEFREKWNVQEQNEAQWGSDYEPPLF